MDDLYCVGNETNLAHCDHIGSAFQDCSHSEDVGVWCSGLSPCVFHGTGSLVGRVSTLQAAVPRSILAPSTFFMER